jgi:4-oxalmesaconate hydratase
MAHHVGTEAVGREWAVVSNDLIHRICTLLPDNFAPVGQLPQFPGRRSRTASRARAPRGAGLRRREPESRSLGRVLARAPLTDRYWYPIYEKLCEHDCPR